MVNIYNNESTDSGTSFELSNTCTSLFGNKLVYAAFGSSSTGAVKTGLSFGSNNLSSTEPLVFNNTKETNTTSTTTFTIGPGNPSYIGFRTTSTQFGNTKIISNLNSGLSFGSNNPSSTDIIQENKETKENEDINENLSITDNNNDTTKNDIDTDIVSNVNNINEKNDDKFSDENKHYYNDEP